MKEQYYSLYHSPVGPLVLVGDDEYLLKLFPKHLLGSGMVLSAEEPTPISVTKRWLDAYFSGINPPIDHLPIKAEGTIFQQKCWQHLLKIPYGSVTTYKDIANHLASDSPTGKMSCQAVGQAVGKNPIAIIIPCHRVIGTNGSLTGYSGGLELKKELLRHEIATKTAL